MLQVCKLIQPSKTRCLRYTHTLSLSHTHTHTHIYTIDIIIKKDILLINLQQVRVETLEKGFQINVFSEKKRPGLLVSILEAFEELGLEVLDARVSCSDNFRL